MMRKVIGGWGADGGQIYGMRRIGTGLPQGQPPGWLGHPNEAFFFFFGSGGGGGGASFRTRHRIIRPVGMAQAFVELLVWWRRSGASVRVV